MASPVFSQPSSPDRTIEVVNGDLYRVRDGAQHTLFLVTSEGIILLDPLSMDFTLWLKKELDARFPQRPVTHVVYSAVDVDRIGGAPVFGPGLTTVAHQTFNQRLDLERGAFPARYRSLDRNANGTLEADEVEHLTLPRSVMRLDLNSDGHLTSGELWSDAPSAQRTYATRDMLRSGSQRVELVHAGSALGAGATVVFFPAERIVFAARYPSLSAPFQDRSVPVAELVKWSKTVTDLEFDTLITAQGETIARSQLTALNEYVNALVSNVAAAHERGRSLEDVLHSSTVPTFSGTPFAGTRDDDLAFLYRRIQPSVIEAYGTALFNYVAVNRTDCDSASSYTCTFGSLSGLAPSVGVGFLWRHLQMSGELSAGQKVQLTTTSTSFVFAPFPSTPSSVTSTSQFATRDTLVTVLAGWRSAPTKTLSVDVLGGPTFMRSKTAAVWSESLFQPRNEFTIDTRSVALTLGADLRAAIAKRVHVIVPVRFTTAGELRLPYGPSLRAGVGFSVALFRWVSESPEK